MVRRKAHVLISAGMGAMVVGLALHQWTGGNSWHFATGFLLGLSVVLTIGGFWKLSRGAK